MCKCSMRNRKGSTIARRSCRICWVNLPSHKMVTDGRVILIASDTSSDAMVWFHGVYMKSPMPLIPARSINSSMRSNLMAPSGFHGASCPPESMVGTTQKYWTATNLRRHSHSSVERVPQTKSSILDEVSSSQVESSFWDQSKRFHAFDGTVLSCPCPARFDYKDVRTRRAMHILDDCHLPIQQVYNIEPEGETDLHPKAFKAKRALLNANIFHRQ